MVKVLSILTLVIRVNYMFQTLDMDRDRKEHISYSSPFSMERFFCGTDLGLVSTSLVQLIILTLPSRWL